MQHGHDRQKPRSTSHHSSGRIAFCSVCLYSTSRTDAEFQRYHAFTPRPNEILCSSSFLTLSFSKISPELTGSRRSQQGYI